MRQVVLVGERGMITSRRIVCLNPLLAEERARKREALLQATEKKLEEIVAATQRPQRALRGQEKIALRVGKLINRYKVGKHFLLEITSDRFHYQRDQEKIDAEAALDGLYVIRTSDLGPVPGPVLRGGSAGLQRPQQGGTSVSLLQGRGPSEGVVRAYKDLSKVERAFRCFKGVDLKVRPIYHWLDERIRAHVFLCLLAYYVEWHMRQRLAPVLFDDHRREEAERTRRSIVAPAPRSEAAQRKDQSKCTEGDQPVHSFRTLLEDLGTLAKNRVRMPGDSSPGFDVLTQATPLQQQILDLLDVPLTL